MTFDLQDMDTIRFESRREIETVAKALEEWQKEHGKDEIIQDFLDKLDVMHMAW